MSEAPAGEAKVRWFLSVQAVMLGLFLVGPLALPLLWFSPKFKPFTKIWMTVLTLFLAWIFLHFSLVLLERLKSQLAELKQSGLLP